MAELFIVREPDETKSSSESTPPDWEARKLALDVQQSWIVEAPAGSGKTGLLIQRFLKLLTDESVQKPEQVLAITFTVKATAEMRERISKQLQLAAEPDVSKNTFERETRALAQAVLERDRICGWELLKQPRRLNIRTIHSVCGEIARSLPVLSGAGGTLLPVEDASVLYREAARRTLMQLGGAEAALNEDLRTLLLHRDGSMADCERLLAQIFSLRDQWGELIPLTDTELDEAHLDGAIRTQLERALEQSVRAGLRRLTAAFPEETLVKLVSLAEQMADSPGYRGTASPIAHCARTYAVPGEDVQDLRHWLALIRLLTTKDGWRKSTSSNHLGFEIERHHALRLRQIHDELRGNDELLAALLHTARLPPHQYPDEQWAMIKVLFRILRRALAELQLVFAERGQCDFTELELLARTALHHDSSSNDLAEMGMKFQHLLVDEMQDTSTNQYTLLELLTRGWDGHSQTVFLVGDPKQSIYLFRHARVERFIRTMLTRGLGDIPLGHLQLTANFRSQDGLVSAFNATFPTLFPATSNILNSEDIPYLEAVPIRKPDSGAKDVVWHTAVLPPASRGQHDGTITLKQSILDARSIQTIIQQWRTRPLPSGRTTPWKIAVLVRTKNLLHSIIEELKIAAIPYRAVDIEPLGERQEVLDLFALTRALLHPADRTAWLAVLRAPWCGLSLAELHILSGADNTDFSQRSIEGLIVERGDLLNEEGCQRLARFWLVMRAAADKQPLLTTPQLVERTWRSLGGDTYLDANEMANARRYLQLLAELETQAGTIDLSLLQHRMESLFAASSANEDAVDLLTIHKAKGLEWDLVIVPGLEKLPRRNHGRLLTWEEMDATEDHSAPFVLAPIAGKGEESKALNVWINSIHTAREIAEQKRLFYVACTRAREELHLFAAAKINSRGEITPASGSLLDTTWPIAHKFFLTEPSSMRQTRSQSSATGPDEENHSVDLAATEETTPQPRLQRLPLQSQPRMDFEAASNYLVINATHQNSASSMSHEGPFDARAFGNAVHTFLESLARHVASGTPIDQLRREVTAWNQRIVAVLRAEGLAPRLTGKYAQQVMTALDNTLQDVEGQWILAAHEDGSSELALTSWQENRTSVRIDRTFKAGTEPLKEGNGTLWIVDYKTATCHTESIEEFLNAERARYEPQLAGYVRMLRSGGHEADVRVGLYFPMLPKFLWWNPER